MSLRRLSGLALLALLTLPPLLFWWEGRMLRHMLGQIPLLVAAGAALAPAPPPPGQRTFAAGFAAVLLAAFTIGFWMLPRWLDAAVNETGADLAKLLALPLLAGVPLGWGWPLLGPVARGFFLAQLIGMALVMGALYLWFPDRLCSNYLESEQQDVGRALLAVAGALALVCAGRALFSPRRQVPPNAA